MKVLIACEYSGRVRQAFAERGHDAWSCDLEPSEQPGQHIQADVLTVLDQGWDMMIAHPPCTYLSYAGMRWFKSQPDRIDKARIAFGFFMALVQAPVPLIAIENPRGYPLSWYKRSDQMIHPWQFGEAATKETHLWLKGLPPRLYTLIITNPVVNWTEHSHRTAKDRSRTFTGIAQAMGSQWG